jgi:hypothetical protein
MQSYSSLTPNSLRCPGPLPGDLAFKVSSPISISKGSALSPSFPHPYSRCGSRSGVYGSGWLREQFGWRAGPGRVSQTDFPRTPVVQTVSRGTEALPHTQLALAI